MVKKCPNRFCGGLFLTDDIICRFDPQFFEVSKKFRNIRNKIFSPTKNDKKRGTDPTFCVEFDGNIHFTQKNRFLFSNCTFFAVVVVDVTKRRHPSAQESRIHREIQKKTSHVRVALRATSPQFELPNTIVKKLVIKPTSRRRSMLPNKLSGIIKAIEYY